MPGHTPPQTSTLHTYGETKDAEGGEQQTAKTGLMHAVEQIWDVPASCSGVAWGKACRPPAHYPTPRCLRLRDAGQGRRLGGELGVSAPAPARPHRMDGRHVINH